MPNEVNWPEAVWNEINDAVVKEAAKVRIAQRVFPTTVFDNDPTGVLNDVITFSDDPGGQHQAIRGDLSRIPVDQCTGQQGEREEDGQDAGSNGGQGNRPRRGTVIFQETSGELPPNVEAEQRESAATGLVREAAAWIELALSILSAVGPVDPHRGVARRDPAVAGLGRTGLRVRTRSAQRRGGVGDRRGQRDDAGAVRHVEPPGVATRRRRSRVSPARPIRLQLTRSSCERY
jgi:hypothetical protein